MWPEKKYIVYKRTAVRLAALKKARMWQYVQKAGRIRGKKKKKTSFNTYFTKENM